MGQLNWDCPYLTQYWVTTTVRVCVYVLNSGYFTFCKGKCSKLSLCFERGVIRSLQNKTLSLQNPIHPRSLSFLKWSLNFFSLAIQRATFGFLFIAECVNWESIAHFPNSSDLTLLYLQPPRTLVFTLVWFSLESVSSLFLQCFWLSSCWPGGSLFIFCAFTVSDCEVSSFMPLQLFNL